MLQIMLVNLHKEILSHCFYLFIYFCLLNLFYFETLSKNLKESIFNHFKHLNVNLVFLTEGIQDEKLPSTGRRPAAPISLTVNTLMCPTALRYLHVTQRPRGYRPLDKGKTGPSCRQVAGVSKSSAFAGAHLPHRLLHLVVQVFDLLLQLLHVVQHLDPLLLNLCHFLFQLHTLQHLWWRKRRIWCALTGTVWNFIHILYQLSMTQL